MSDIDTLRQTLAEIAADAGTADLYDRTLYASRRLGRRRMATAVIVAAIFALVVSVPLALTGHDRATRIPAVSPSVFTAAPYYLAVPADSARVEVFDAQTRTHLATIDPPAETVDGTRYTTAFTMIAGARDDRTFVLCATAVTDRAAPLPAWFFEVRLDARGRPGPLQPLGFIHEQVGTLGTQVISTKPHLVGQWQQVIGAMALTDDGSELAILVNRVWQNDYSQADIVVASLTTGSVRTFTSPGRALGNLSWAGDHTLAYACDGVCLLDITSSPTDLTAGERRSVISPATESQNLVGYDEPWISPDGTTIYATSTDDAAGTEALITYSIATGRMTGELIPPTYGLTVLCSVLWSDPTGNHLIVSCGWGKLVGTIDSGVFRAVTGLLPATVGQIGSAGDMVAW